MTAKRYHRVGQGQELEPLVEGKWRGPQGLHAIAVLALIVALLLARLPIWLAGANVHLSLFMDDSGYYLEGARRALETHSWPSMDGIEHTNGFHPLYMLLLIMLQAVVGSDPHAVIPAVMAIQLTLGAIAIFLLAREAAIRGLKSSGLWVGLLFALNPGWMEHGLCGVENGLSSLLILVAALRWESRFATQQTGRLRSWAADGALLGFAVAARTDSVLFAFAYLAVGAWRSSSRDGLRAALIGAGLATCVALLVIAPWIVANLHQFGTFRQDSEVALATRFESEYGRPFSLASLRISLVTLGFWWIRILWSSGLVPLTGWGLGLAIPIDRWRSLRVSRWMPWAMASGCGVVLFLRGNDSLDIGSVRIAAIEAGLGALALVGGLCSARARDDSARPLCLMLGLYAVMTISAYSFFFRAFQSWYSTAVCLVAVLLPTGRAIAPVLAGRRGLALVMLAFMATQSLLVTRGLLTGGAREGLHPHLFDEGERLREKLEEFTASTHRHARFASFDSGKLSYLVHPFPITNADGVMNHRAAEALTKRHLDIYLAKMGVTHVIGEPNRVAEFAAISPFRSTPDTSLTRVLGVPVSRVLPGH